MPSKSSSCRARLHRIYFIVDSSSGQLRSYHARLGNNPGEVCLASTPNEIAGSVFFLILLRHLWGNARVDRWLRSCTRLRLWPDCRRWDRSGTTDPAATVAGNDNPRSNSRGTSDKKDFARAPDRATVACTCGTESRALRHALADRIHFRRLRPCSPPIVQKWYPPVDFRDRRRQSGPCAFPRLPHPWGPVDIQVFRLSQEQLGTSGGRAGHFGVSGLPAASAYPFRN